MVLPALLALIPAMFNGLANLATSWMDKKKVEAQGKVDIAKAKVEGEIRLRMTRMEGDQAYDIKVAEDMAGSWKDEWFVILLSIPAILCFINDSWAQHVLKGFQALAQAPDWYKWSFVGAIVASFGLKSLVRPMLAKWFGVKDEMTSSAVTTSESSSGSGDNTASEKSTVVEKRVTSGNPALPEPGSGH